MALPNAEIMIHQPSGGTQGQATEIQIAAEHILRTKKRLNDILSAMTAEEALDYGLIDSIVEKRPDKK